MTERENAGGTRVLARDPAARLLRAYRLRVSTPGGPERAEELAVETARVGSAPTGNDVVLSDPSVSRYHFQVDADGHGFRLQDLDSTNGTFVDGVRARDVYLRPGAVVEAGHCRLVFEPRARDVEERLWPEDRFGPLVGRSEVMRRLFAALDRVAPSPTTVLVEGESGTGKELVAQALHSRSPRAGGPFVVFDCAAVPQGTLESELFGHEKGAFTGAESRRDGVVLEADGGTLFIDEIGELPIELQPKLLRVLESREVRRLGGRKPVSVDIRVVAATNRDLAREVNAGAFREDLFYRLAVIRLRLPPLRDRREDVPLLVESLVRKLLARDPARAEAVLASVGDETWRRLTAHPWRGNVRELRNVIERTLALAGEAEALDPTLTWGGPGGPPAAAPPREPTAAAPRVAFEVDLDRPLIDQRAELVERFERDYIAAMVERHAGKIAPAARAAGIDRMYFKRLMKKRGL